MSNYPPGVTGSEYRIAGPDYVRDYSEACPDCGAGMIEQGYRNEDWVTCVACPYRKDLPCLEEA